jgi:hypothetical protein
MRKQLHADTVAMAWAVHTPLRLRHPIAAARRPGTLSKWLIPHGYSVRAHQSVGEWYWNHPPSLEYGPSRA